MNNPAAGQLQALKQYAQINIQTGAENASPHRLIQMLMEGALSNILKAKNSMKADQPDEKGKHISAAISIIGGLRDSLDQKQGGQIADNLDRLYEYMTQRLMQANINNDSVLLDEVYGLLAEIKQAWDAIAKHPEVVKMENTTHIESAA